MTETLHFTYDSPENTALLLINILYERQKFKHVNDKIDFLVWRDRFNMPDAEQIVLKLMTELLPEGGMIGKKELNSILEATIKFTKIDSTCKHLMCKYQRQLYSGYVYSKYNDICKFARFGDHTSTVYEMTEEFFCTVDLSDFSQDAVKKFIIENFELGGSQVSIETIARDILYFYWRQI